MRKHILVILGFFFIFLAVESKAVEKHKNNNLSAPLLIKFDELPFESAIKIIKGDGSRKIAVFSEIDCGYCKLLEKNELTKINNVTVYTFLFLNAPKISGAWKKSEAIWCSDDKEKAWLSFVNDKALDVMKDSCDTPIMINNDLAKKIGVKATPTIFYANGTRSVGILKAKQIEQRLLDANFFNE